mgnify:CR=1 FL=1
MKIITDLENFKSPKTNNEKKKKKENYKYRKIKKVVRLVERSVNQIIDEVVKSNSQPSKIENSTVAMTPASNSVNENKKNDMATSPFVFYTPVPLSDFEKKDYFSDANSSNSVASLNSFSQLGYNFSTDETGFNSPQVINNTFPDTLSELLPSCTPEEKTSKMLNEWGLSGILSPAYEEDTVDPNNINLKNSIICESTTDTDTSSETEEKSFNNVEEVKKYLIGNDFLRENQINFIEHLKKMVLKKQTDKKYDEANIYKSLIFFFLLFNHFSPQQFLNFLQEKKPSLIDTYKEQLKKNTMQNDIPQNNTKAATLSDNIQNFYHEASQFSALKKIDTENEQKKTNFFTSKTSLFKFFYPESKEDNKNPTLLKYFDGQAREVFKSEKIFSNNTLDNDLYKVYEEQYFSKLLK